MTHQTDIDVLIVGAGPTGLTLACLLARYGVKFRIIDKKKSTTTRSKALGIQARTLELFEQLDLTEKILAIGHPATGLDLVARGQLRASSATADSNFRWNVREPLYACGRRDELEFFRPAHNIVSF